MTTRYLFSLAAALGLSCSFPTYAAVLADYPFTGNSPASVDTEPLTDATNVIFGAFSGGAGSQTITSNELRVPTNATGDVGADSDTLAEALALGNYVTFTIETKGNTVSFSELTFDHSFVNALVGTSSSIAVMSSATGFSNGDELAVYTFTGNVGNSGPLTRTIDLSSEISLQNVTTDVEFRLYFYDNSDTGARYTAVDNIVLEGSAVPEPAGAGLLAAGVGVVTLWRRRRMRAVCA